MGLLLACRHVPGFLSIQSACLVVCLVTPGRLTPELCEKDTSQLKLAQSLDQLY